MSENTSITVAGANPTNNGIVVVVDRHDPTCINTTLHRHALVRHKNENEFTKILPKPEQKIQRNAEALNSFLKI